MAASVAALSGIRILWRGFRRLPCSHRHRDAHVAQRLLDAAASEPKELLEQLDTTNEGLTSEAAATRLSTLGPNLVAHLLICKGAVEEVFAVCTDYAMDNDVARLDASHVVQMQQQTTRLNADGFRVVAVAYKEIAEPRPNYHVGDESDLILLGYIAFLDPPKESAGIAIAAPARSGVRVKILTGDHDIIARKICREVGVARTTS